MNLVKKQDTEQTPAEGVLNAATMDRRTFLKRSGIGVGGIGCSAASYLAASGVGRLVLCDFDTVDASNLGRQILYGPDDIGEAKAKVASRRLGAINPDIEIRAIAQRLDDAQLRREVAAADVDGDGDLGIVGHAWDSYELLDLWRNDGP